jgi:ribonuclease HI
VRPRAAVLWVHEAERRWHTFFVRKLECIEASLAGERSLLDPKVRANRSMIDSLLHPDFAERGQSGRWWTREQTLRTLPEEAELFEPVEVSELHGDEVADGVVLVTYVSVRGSAAVGRSSMWVEHQGQMVMRWHQGTPLSSSS